MANPNLLTATTIKGFQTGGTLYNTSATTLVSNSSSSGKLVVIKSLYISNIDSVSAHTIDIIINDGDSDGQLTNNLSIPLQSTVQVIDKQVYLEENSTLTATASTAQALDYVISFQEIS